MTIHEDVQILRSKLIAMTRLTQRTVDYSIKAFQLGRPELCRTVKNSKEEMCAIRGWIADHGRAILATRTPADGDASFACAALRISTALEVTYDAAYNIARRSAIRFAAGWTPVSSALEDAGNFVNNLLRLCILSLLKRDVRHAKAVLQNGTGQSFDLGVYLAHHDLAQRISGDARFELALVRDLDEISGQVREIADALVQWHEDIERRQGTEDAGRSTRHARPVAGSEPASSCSALRLVGALPALRDAHLNKTDDCCFPSRNVARAVPGEDFAQARLTGLQQRVCELLVKNQQLRMALMAERADSYHEQPC